MNPSQPLHGLVLAGGHSSRMGTDKAALLHPDGRSLARRAYDLLVQAGCGQVMLSLRHDQPIPAGFDDLADVAVVRDPDGGSAGPLVGIVAAMGLRPDADWLVLACDLPRLDVETLSHLVASKRPDEMFLSYRSEFDGLPEPLCALYTPAALPLLRDTEFRCPRKVLIRHECRLLEPVTPHALDNANTPEDWQTANRSMNTHSIQYFGLLAERRGLAEETIITASDTPAAIYQEINTRQPLGMAMKDLRAVVNDEFASWDQPLRDGDRIAFLPPMSGG
jgi:molybdopterin-guanine dinucleotide biosynthesis protein A